MGFYLNKHCLLSRTIMSNLVHLTKGAHGLGQQISRRVPVKPVMSSNRLESQRRVRGHYKQWIRAVPDILGIYKLPYTEQEMKNRIREEFYKHSQVRDLRVVDLLIVKGQMDLQETLQHWKQICHMMEFFGKPTDVARPQTFMGKFLSGKN